MPSAAFSLNGGAPGAKLSIAASGAITAELDDLTGVRYVEWEVVSTDETTEPADFTLSVTAGAIPGAESTSFNAGGLGTAGILRARVNNGRDLQTGETDETATTATAKWYVPTAGSALEVGAARENDQSDPTFGWTGIVNQAIRITALFSGADVDPTPDTIALRGSSGQLKAVWYTDGSAIVAASGLVRTANNATVVAARNAGNTADITVLATNASNHIVIGEATDCVRVVNSVATGGVWELLINGVSTTTIGANLSLSAAGKVVIGGTDVVSAAGGGATFGDNATVGANYRTASGTFHTWFVNNIGEMQLGSTGLTLVDPVTATAFVSATGTPASTGLLRSEKNTTAVAFRNDGNTADLRAVRMGATNHLQLGDSSEVVNTEYHVKAAGEHRFYVDSALKAAFGASGLSMNSLPVTSVQDPSSAQDAATKAYVDSLSHSISEFTSDGSVVIPSNAYAFRVRMMGGGGKGGGGGCRGVGVAAGGGGGGGGGAFNEAEFVCTSLQGQTINVVVGVGGTTGGVGASTNDGDGTAGQAGAASSITIGGVTYLTASGGSGGAGGTSGNGAGGGGATAAARGAGGGGGSGAGTAGSNGTNGGGGGGGGGGNISAAEAEDDGGSGGSRTIIHTGGSASAGGTQPGGDGVTGTVAIGAYGGGGGGGGASSTATAAGNGASGGASGGGGGGGGATRNGQTAGNAGAGANGYVVIQFVRGA